MKLLLTGVSHKTAPVEVREALSFREETLADSLADLKSRPGVTEAVILRRVAHASIGGNNITHQGAKSKLRTLGFT